MRLECKLAHRFRILGIALRTLSRFVGWRERAFLPPQPQGRAWSVPR